MTELNEISIEFCIELNFSFISIHFIQKLLFEVIQESSI